MLETKKKDLKKKSENVKKWIPIQYYNKKFLFERISLAIQRGNAASIRGTFPDSAILSEIFVL
jgi:hypothetical protein